MSSPADWNALDRAIHALCKSKAALPEVYRALTQGELCALMPYHPEVVETDLQLKNGSPFQFVRLKDKAFRVGLRADCPPLLTLPRPPVL